MLLDIKRLFMLNLPQPGKLTQWEFQKRTHNGTTKSLEVSAHTKHPTGLKSIICIPSS